MTTNLERAMEWLIEWNNKQALHPSQDKCTASLAALLTQVQAEARLAALEEARKAVCYGCRYPEQFSVKFDEGAWDQFGTKSWDHYLAGEKHSKCHAEAIRSLAQAAAPATKEG